MQVFQLTIEQHKRMIDHYFYDTQHRI